MQCARHPDTETFIRCSKCDTPICPKCFVQGPAGARCRDCASLRSTPLYRVDPRRGVAAVFVGAALGLAGGYVIGMAREGGLFAQGWAALLGGLFAGEVVRRVMGMKQGRTPEIIALASITTGALAGIMLQSGGWEPTIIQRMMGEGGMDWPRKLALVAVMGGMAFSRVRHL